MDMSPAKTSPSAIESRKVLFSQPIGWDSFPQKNLPIFHDAFPPPPAAQDAAPKPRLKSCQSAARAHSPGQLAW